MLLVSYPYLYYHHIHLIMYFLLTFHYFIISPAFFNFMHPVYLIYTHIVIFFSVIIINFNYIISIEFIYLFTFIFINSTLLVPYLTYLFAVFWGGHYIFCTTFILYFSLLINIFLFLHVF